MANGPAVDQNQQRATPNPAPRVDPLDMEAYAPPKASPKSRPGSAPGRRADVALLPNGDYAYDGYIDGAYAPPAYGAAPDQAPGVWQQQQYDPVETERQRLAAWRAQRGAYDGPYLMSPEEEAVALVERLVSAVRGPGHQQQQHGEAGSSGYGQPHYYDATRFDTAKVAAARERGQKLKEIKQNVLSIRERLSGMALDTAQRLRVSSGRGVGVTRATAHRLAIPPYGEDGGPHHAQRQQQLEAQHQQHGGPPTSPRQSHLQHQTAPYPLVYSQPPAAYAPGGQQGYYQQQQGHQAPGSPPPHAPPMQPPKRQHQHINARPQGLRPQQHQQQQHPGVPNGGPPQAQGQGMAMAERTSRGGAQGQGRAGGGKDQAERMSEEDSARRSMILSEILDTAPSVGWDDIADLANAKQALIEAVVLPTMRADIFTGLRAPVRGILLFGPPGNGKPPLLQHARRGQLPACSTCLRVACRWPLWPQLSEPTGRPD